MGCMLQSVRPLFELFHFGVRTLSQVLQSFGPALQSLDRVLELLLGGGVGPVLAW